MMLIIDSVVYLLIALYVEAVFPGEYGVPHPWYFPLTSNYWCGQSKYTSKFTTIVKNEKHIFFTDFSNYSRGIFEYLKVIFHSNRTDPSMY